MAQPIAPVVTEGRAPAAPVVTTPAPRWVEFVLLCAVAAVTVGVMRAAAEWRAPLSPGFRISLSPIRLPYYAALSTLRMVLAYLVSLVFSIAYARFAASSKAAERVLLPLLDILQSIPILSFMPGVVLGLVALFPGRTLGLELAAVILIFTSQAWNLAFSFHQSLITIPSELTEAARIYRLGFWRKFTRLELPFGVISLIANSMMSWAGGWFFLMASEQFAVGDGRLRLPGLGSYLAAAADAGDTRALVYGLLTLVIVIVLLDQILWRPMLAWSDRFKFESAGGDAPSSRVLDALRGSRLIDALRSRVLRPAGKRIDHALGASRNGDTPDTAPADMPPARRHRRRIAGIAALVLAAAAVVWGLVLAAGTLSGLTEGDWGRVGVSAAATLARTTIALLIAAAWTVPAGVAIGTNPRWARRLQPIVQITASIPATAVFPVLLLALLAIPGGLNVAAVALMLLGTQWYVLFNVIAGAMAIPSDLKEAATMYHVAGWRRWKTLILPAIFPYLVTGMITATGGAWNASIVAEYVTFAGHTTSTTGLGALIAGAAEHGDFPILLAGTLVMAGIVIVMNRLLWRRLYGYAETRFRLG
ncbi:MAG TPA: ABC transporter permease subunit [Gemmatimonadaceae bacterium]|nr:ABC transporter permease subunit [Gemmatimonadaceae bacterium]